MRLFDAKWKRPPKRSLDPDGWSGERVHPSCQASSRADVLLRMASEG